MKNAIIDSILSRIKQQKVETKRIEKRINKLDKEIKLGFKKLEKLK